MDLEAFRSHCIRKKGVTEEFPFGEETLVYKVMGKVFALTSITEFSGVNLKVDPEKGVELRERYEGVNEGYHMNKKHWITVNTGSFISDKLIKEWIDDSYNLVANGLTKKLKTELASL